MYIELNILLAVGIDCTDIMMIVGLDFRADCVHRICFSYLKHTTIHQLVSVHFLVFSNLRFFSLSFGFRNFRGK